MTTPPVLDRIVAGVRETLAQSKRDTPLADLERIVTPANHEFARAIACDGLSLIAEIKPASPSEGKLREPLDLDAILAAYEPRAAAISVLTEPHVFGGSLDLLREVAARSARPLLRKDFIIDSYQIIEARAAGAQAALLIAVMFSDPGGVERLAALIDVAAALGMDALVECHDTADIDRATAAGARILGINNRDLRTLVVDRETVPRLAPRVPDDVLLVAESGYSHHAHLDALRTTTGANAVLIGSHFMRAPNIAGAIDGLFPLPSLARPLAR